MYPFDANAEVKLTWWGKFAQRPFWQQLYLSGALILGMLVLLTNVTAFWPTAKVQFVLGALLMAGGVTLAAGFIVWCWPHIERLWAHWIGRVGLVILNALFLLVATALARGTVSASLQLPPQDFDLTVALFALPNYVYVWYVLLSLVTGVTSVAMFLHAICKAVVDPSRRFPGWTMLHATGAFAVTIFLIGPFDSATKYLLDKEFVRMVAYAADFYEAQNYPGVQPKERIRLHENGVVSTATIVAGKVVITTTKRDF